MSKLLTTAEPKTSTMTTMKTKKLSPIHPGEILPEEFMKPHGLSQNALARALDVPPRRINEIVLEKRGITADTALRLGRFLGTSAELWLGLQAEYDLRMVRREIGESLESSIVPLKRAAGSYDNATPIDSSLVRERPAGYAPQANEAMI